MHTHLSTQYDGEKIIIIDFGGQFTQNIAKKVRKLGIYSEIIPYHDEIQINGHIKGIILSGSPCSVNEEGAPRIDLDSMLGKLPILGICYGAQLIANHTGNTVSSTEHRQYGTAPLDQIQKHPLRSEVPNTCDVLMSHGDAITDVDTTKLKIIGKSNGTIAAYELVETAAPVRGVQFHPEVHHTTYGSTILSNFLFKACWCIPDSRTPSNFVETSIASIKEQLGDDHCIMAISWGVDSTVAATLIHRAIGSNLTCFFVDNGLLRQGEYEQVLETYKQIWLNVEGIDAKQRFYDVLAGITDPEKKRKVIWNLFIKIFEEKAKEHQDAKWLGQGTIYPDVIESVSVGAKSSLIKSHHNVGWLPETMEVDLIEPLRYLFKDDVRRVGRDIKIPAIIIGRHPFPGPGLAIRIVGQDITPSKVDLLQQADHLFIAWLKEWEDNTWVPLYENVWQAGVMLLPVFSVWVMGDERTYEQTVALRAVHSVDGMTANRVHLPHDFLAYISKEIIAKVKGINRVVYDISDKPPATIEWE